MRYQIRSLRRSQPVVEKGKAMTWSPGHAPTPNPPTPVAERMVWLSVEGNMVWQEQRRPIWPWAAPCPYREKNQQNGQGKKKFTRSSSWGMLSWRKGCGVVREWWGFCYFDLESGGGQTPGMWRSNLWFEFEEQSMTVSVQLSLFFMSPL